jgi:cysteine-rich repeat protein
MKRTMLLALAAFTVSVLLAGAAAAGPHRRPPAKASECRGLHGASFGLCRAYCDALRCSSDDERRACEQLRHLFARLTRGDSLPCESTPVCGDGEVNQDGEECDDGNNDSCDGCSFDCRAEFCGDGSVCEPEQCEPGDVCEGGLGCGDDCVCPEPPPSVPCGLSPAPECGGECPAGLVCTDLGILPTCECFAL